MTSLPPYSTYRTDSKQMMFPQATSHGNILTFTPPGLKQSLNVKFPDSRLAVCEKCKKNFKTRDMCRVRNTHTTAPWTTAYICLTLDDSCTDENGKFIDKPYTVRMVQWQPYCVKASFDPKTPVCAACKKTNRTRSFCRERHKHRQLPWCTVYVLLSTLDSADPSTVVAGSSKPVESGAKKESTDDDGEGESKKIESESPTNAGQDEASAAESKTSESLDGISENIKPDEGKQSEDNDGEDIHDIAESRTFLAKVSCRGTSIQWLELAEFEASEAGAVPPMGHPDPAYGIGPPMPPVDPNQAHYYHHAMGYAAQQHQNALKNQQQYFFQMQQQHPHHYAAQQAAWQAHYRPPPHMPMHGQPMPPGQGPAPPPAEGGPAPAPAVTAGEAAALNSKRREMSEEGNEQSNSPPPPPPHIPPGQQPPPHGQHPPPHGQHPPPHGQHQWMLYQQMYQAQLPPMGQPPPYPPHRPGQPPEGMPPPLMPTEQQQQQQYNAPPQTPEGNGKSNHENDSKRQRLV